MSGPSIDLATDAGAHAAARLENDRIGWLTTVASDGTPQSSPIWFIWDGDEFLLYSLESVRVRNIADRPRVSLNLDGDGLGGDVLVVEGTARIDRDAPSADRHSPYLEKYKAVMDGYDWTPEWFAREYPVPIRVTPTRYRYW